MESDFNEEIKSLILNERFGLGHHRIVCPCAAFRKAANRREKTLSIDVEFEKSIYSCHHCGSSGAVRTETSHSTPAQKEKRLKLRKADDDQARDWLLERKISQEAIDRCGVKFVEWLGSPAVAYAYYKDGAQYAAKVRNIDKKKFAWDGNTTDAYLWHLVDFTKDFLYITEGECFPGEAEILTPHGWVRFDAYRGEDVCAVSETGKAFFEKPRAIIKKEYDGDLIRLETRGYVSVTTPDHNLITITTNSRKNPNGWRKVPAKDNHRFNLEVMPRTCHINGVGIPLTNDQIAFSLAISADATIDIRASGSRYARVSFSKERKINRFRDILNRLKIKFIETHQPSQKEGYIFFGLTLPEWAPGRFLPHEWIGLAASEQREFILEEMVNWDGNNVKTRNQTEYSSKYRKNATFMQAIAHTSGRCSSIISRSNSYGKWFKVSILHGKTTTSRQQLKRTDIPHKGMVYCVQTSTGNILVRQEDKITVTGNCDALSLVTAGFENVISVPHGAPNSGNDKGEYRFAFMAENAAKFAGFKRIILCGDQDPRGNDLIVELSRRLGRHRCYELKLPEGQKDCNETLMFSGIAALRKAVNEAKPFDIPGMAPASAFRENVYRLYDGEIGTRMSTGIPCLDKIYTICPGMFTVWTGHPGSGKSLLLDWLNIKLAQTYDLKIGAWSAEVPGHIHVSKLAEVVAGKRFHSGMKNRMDKEELERSLEFIESHMFFMTQDEAATTESLIERATAMVMRYGIKSLILDPFNYISFPGAKREDLEISDMLSAWLNWAKTYEVWTNMVAHPRNLQPEDIPNGNHIAGGAMFKAKADFGMTVHREGNTNSVFCWKAKHDHIGKLGSVELGYDSTRCNFFDPDSEEGQIERASRRRPTNDYDDPEDD